jgi:hypothetical protein
MLQPSLTNVAKMSQSEKGTPIIFSGVIPLGVSSLCRVFLLYIVIFVLFLSSHISPVSFIHDMFTILNPLRSIWCRMKMQERWLYRQPCAMYFAFIQAKQE